MPTGNAKGEPTNEKGTKMASKKNENRKTTVKGFIVTLEPLNKEAFEIETPYTRSDKKAVELVSEIMTVSDGQIITISELINEPLKKTVYDAGRVMEYQVASFDDFETAIAHCADEQVVIKYTLHYYDGVVFGQYNENGKYFAETFSDYSPLKFGKVDARGFVKLMAEGYFDANVIYVHDVNRSENTHYAIVNDCDIEKCAKIES